MRFALPVMAAVVLVGAHTARAVQSTTQPAQSAQSPTTAPAISDAVLDAALDATRNAVQSATFDATLRSVASRFPLIPVSTAPGQPIWNKLLLNQRAKWIDAFRFRVPNGPPRDMLWSFISNETRYEWYIFAVDGQPMQGFARNWYYKPQDLLGDRTPAGAKDLVLQTLPAANLRSGAEYVIWLKFRHGKPRPTYVAINLLPASADPAAIDAPDYIVREMGLNPAGDPIAVTAIDHTPATKPTTMPKPKKATTAKAATKP
jgi:hypothetical protein